MHFISGIVFDIYQSTGQEGSGVMPVLQDDLNRIGITLDLHKVWGSDRARKQLIMKS